MRTQKLLALFLALLMTSSCVIGCGQGTTEETISNTADITAEQTESETEEETKVSDDLPESDFEGYTFNIFNSNPESNNWFTTVHVTAAEDSGDSIPSAIFNRNIAVEDRLNIHIVETEQTVDQIKNTTIAGDGSFDMSLMQGSAVLSQAQSGYLMDLHTMPYQNFDKPYWDHNAVEQLSIGGKLYMGVGDFLTTQIDETCCMYFNKALITNHDLEDPYDLVHNGKWTLDKLAEMATVSGNDVDGNGTFDDNDDYGLMSWAWRVLYVPAQRLRLHPDRKGQRRHSPVHLLQRRLCECLRKDPVHRTRRRTGVLRCGSEEEHQRSVQQPPGTGDHVPRRTGHVLGRMHQLGQGSAGNGSQLWDRAGTQV